MPDYTPLDVQAVTSRRLHARFGSRIIYEAASDSTMNVARRAAESGAAEGTVVVAEEQTAGRGRFGRAWISPAGKNLYLTLIARPPVNRLRVLSMAAPLAVCLSAEEVAGVRPVIKWPNDILVAGRKLSGVLIESELSGDSVRFALVGVGINVNVDVSQFAELAAIATSLYESGSEVSREHLLGAFLTHFETLYSSEMPSLVAAWRDRLATLGRTVTVALGSETHEGVAEDVDEMGNLILRLPDGTSMTFEAGEVSLRGSAV